MSVAAAKLHLLEFGLTSVSVKDKETKAPTKELMALFDTLHRRIFDGAKAPLLPGRDPKLLADLWRQRQGDKISAELLIRAFFERRDLFVMKRGYSVPILMQEVPKLIMWLSRHRRPSDLAEASKYADVTRGIDRLEDPDAPVES